MNTWKDATKLCKLNSEYILLQIIPIQKGISNFVLDKMCLHLLFSALYKIFVWLGKVRLWYLIDCTNCKIQLHFTFGDYLWLRTFGSVARIKMCSTQQLRGSPQPSSEWSNPLSYLRKTNRFLSFRQLYFSNIKMCSTQELHDGLSTAIQWMEQSII